MFPNWINKFDHKINKENRKLYGHPRFVLLQRKAPYKYLLLLLLLLLFVALYNIVM